jgi:hypothetical protein
MMLKKTSRVQRGLWWIYQHARADFEVASGERGTGAFAGTTEKEVDEALEWLHDLLHGDGKHG